MQTLIDADNKPRREFAHLKINERSVTVEFCMESSLSLTVNAGSSINYARIVGNSLVVDTNYEFIIQPLTFPYYKDESAYVDTVISQDEKYFFVLEDNNIKVFTMNPALKDLSGEFEDLDPIKTIDMKSQCRVMYDPTEEQIVLEDNLGWTEKHTIGDKF